MASDIRIDSSAGMNNINPCFREIRARIKVHLHPSRLGNVSEGIDEILNQYLMRSADARSLAYMIQSCATVLYDIFCLTFKINPVARACSYNEAIQGVVLAYSRVKPLETAGMIFDARPFVHFHVDTKLVAFCPEIGAVMGMTSSR